jgi:DNA-binding beta-propeller fold protein YncE
MVGCKRHAATSTSAITLGIVPTRAAYVTNNGSDTLSVLDRDGTHTEIRSLDLDPDAHEAPHHLAIDAAKKAVYVALSFPAPPSEAKGPHKGHGGAAVSGKIARLDLDSLSVTTTRDVDPNPGDLVLTSDHTRLLVTHFDLKRAMDAAMAGRPPSEMFATLQVWDTETLERVASRPLCVAPHGITATRDGRTAIVACYGSDEIAVVDLKSPTLTSARYPLGAAPGVPGAPQYGPYSTTLAPDEVEVVVADLEGQDLRVFDLGAKRFVPELEVALGARAFMPAFVDARVLLMPLQAPDGLARIDVSRARVEARIFFQGAACPSPHVARFAKDGRAYVVCEGDHVHPGVVLEVDPATLATKKRWEVGVYPDGIAFGDD